MENLDHAARSLVLRYLDWPEVIRLRQVSEKFHQQIDAPQLAEFLLFHFPRLRGAHEKGDTFAQTARRWTTLRISLESYQAFFALSKNADLVSMAWTGGDGLALGCQVWLETMLCAWDMQEGKGSKVASLGTFFPTKMQSLGSRLGVWSGEACAVVDWETGDVTKLVGPTSNVVNNQIATIDTETQEFRIFDLDDMTRAVQVVDTRLPPEELFQAKITLTPSVLVLRTAGYRLVYERSTGELVDKKRAPRADVQMTSMGLALVEGVGAKRVWQFPDRRLVMKLEQPDIHAVVGDYMVVRHILDDQLRESLFDRKGAFCGHLEQPHDLYAFDGVRLAASNEDGVHLYRVTPLGVQKEGELTVGGKVTALAFTVHYLVIGLQLGTLYRFTLVKPPVVELPKSKKGLKSLIGRIKKQ